MIPADDYRHVALGDVESTNLECLAKAREGDPGKLWITANRQLGGRARRGRHWVSEPGNLYASLLLIDPAASTAALASLPLVAGVAVHAAIRAALPPGGMRATLKWPNDVLLEGAKVSGILLESELLDDGRQAVVIGCGINVVQAPDHALYPAATLRAAGSAVSPEELFAHLCHAMADWLARWNGGQGIASVREAWLANATGIGQHITVNLPDRALTGRFQEIDMAGCLVLVDDLGHRRTIAAGDVFFD